MTHYDARTGAYYSTPDCSECGSELAPAIADSFEVWSCAECGELRTYERPEVES